MADDEDQPDRERHPRRHVEQPATKSISRGGARLGPLPSASFRSMPGKKKRRNGWGEPAIEPSMKLSTPLRLLVFAELTF